MSANQLKDDAHSISPEALQRDQDGTLMIASGIGVGALGAGAALAVGAVCPLCYVVPPVLIAAGVWNKMTAKRPADTTGIPTPQLSDREKE